MAVVTPTPAAAIPTVTTTAIKAMAARPQHAHLKYFQFVEVLSLTFYSSLIFSCKSLHYCIMASVSASIATNFSYTASSMSLTVASQNLKLALGLASLCCLRFPIEWMQNSFSPLAYDPRPVLNKAPYCCTSWGIMIVSASLCSYVAL